ncbi:MAG: FAD-dependent oxidoreductase [Hyphomicrobiales bacterium]|nr:FAD-dependent oxidoreductase [Hyphomicrobiales bacterium]
MSPDGDVRGTVHVVGAGLAGLACAVRLAARGRDVRLYEAAGQAGGRCRSYHDAALGRRIDNGNHLLLSGNHAAMAYLAETGAGDSLTGPATAEFPFLDLATGERWTLRPSAGAIPWWIFAPSRRVPGTGVRDYLRGVRILTAGPGATVAGVTGGQGALYRRFWEPLAVAALNTAADEGAARLLAPVLRETFGRGEAACRPRIAAVGLSESLVDPALATLAAAGARVAFNTRVRRLDLDGGRVTALDDTPLAAADAVVLAVPPRAAAELVPGLTVPDESRAIVNVHFRLPDRADGVRIVGLVGGTAQWVFRRDDIASVTVSAAEGLVDAPAEDIAARTWPEVAAALELAAAEVPPCRVVKEKRATFAQTPAQVARRPATRTAWRNLFLAGDWTDTGLPATIEGAVRSGQAAAAAVVTEPQKT